MHKRKSSERVTINGKECLKFVKKDTQVSNMPQVKQPKGHAPQATFYAEYVLKRNHFGKVVAKFVGARTKDLVMKRSVWVSKVLVTNMRGPKQIWVPKSKN